MGWVLDRVLHLLHPFMPFVTEEIWQNLRTDLDEACLMRSSWHGEFVDFTNDVSVDAADINWVIQVISEVRSIKAEMNIAPKQQLDLRIYEASVDTHRRAKTYTGLLMKLARLESLEAIQSPLPEADSKGAAQFIIGEATAVLPLAGAIDLTAEKDRLGKELGKLDQEISGIQKKLSNENFVSRAPEDVVEENRNRLNVAMQTKEKLTQALGRLSV